MGKHKKKIEEQNEKIIELLEKQLEAMSVPPPPGTNGGDDDDDDG